MRWLLACAVAATIVAGAEVGARQYGFGSPLLYRAASAGYEMVPNQKIERLGHVTTINNIGTRGKDVSPIPAPGTFRVIVLGDSVANGGTMLNDEQIFAAIASRRMASKGCRNEIIDTAAGGWSLHDEIAWIHEHGLFGADTVVWTINHLDLDQARTDPTVLDNHPSFPSRSPSTALSEISTRYVLPKLGLGTGNSDGGSTGGDTVNTEELLRVLAAITAFKTELDQQHVRLIVLYHQGPLPLTSDRAVARNQFMQSLADLHIPVIDTGLSAMPDPRSRFIDTIHPNAQGHAVIGHTLSTKLAGMCPRSAHT